MLDYKDVAKSMSKGYLNMGRQASNAQHERFLELLKASEQLLAEDGITLDLNSRPGWEFQIHSPVGTVLAERRSFLNGDAIAAALVFYSADSAIPVSEKTRLGAVRLYDDRPWMFSGDIPIFDHHGRNVPASTGHVVRLVLEKKLQYDHEFVMS